MRSLPRDLKILNEMPSTKLFALEEQILELEKDPGFQQVAEIVEDYIEARHAGMVTSQKPLEQAEYAQRLGFENGCRFGIDVVASIKVTAAKRRAKLEAANAAREAATAEEE